MNSEFAFIIKSCSEQYFQAPPKYYDNRSSLSSLENYLLREAHKYPDNNDIWLWLISVQYWPELQEYENIDFYVDKFLEKNPENIDALIIKLYSQWRFASHMLAEVARKLMKLKAQQRPEKEAMALCVLGLYFEYKKDWNKVEQCYKEAIKLASHFVYPYFRLGYYYANPSQARLEEARDLFAQGLLHVVSRKEGQYSVDLTDINEFFQKHITGIHAEQSEIGRVKEYL